MGLVILLFLVTIFCVFGFLRSIKSKNMLAIGLSFVSILLFGWFSIMTLIHSGYPGAH